jgi:hypothetical protein
MCVQRKRSTKCKQMMSVQDLRLYLMNATSFTIASLNWLEPALEIVLLLVTIGYTVNKWHKLRNK